MKKGKMVKFLICFDSGLIQLFQIFVKNDKDLEKFKQLKFKNVIKIDEIK